MIEIWRDIKGYETLYQVSNLGRVKSLKYNKEKILKPKKEKNGYLRFGFWKDGEQKWYQVHRLVASAFLPNDNLFKTQVNHIDEDKTNNSVDNLEWCDAQYNIEYSQAKAVNQYTLDGEYIKSWKSTHEIERELGYSNSHIIKCCMGKLNTAYKYKWSYV